MVPTWGDSEDRLTIKGLRGLGVLVNLFAMVLFSWIMLHNTLRFVTTFRHPLDVPDWSLRIIGHDRLHRALPLSSICCSRLGARSSTQCRFIFNILET